jgi:hypothetical protein
MSPQDAHKLLGGYATGTLTPAEQQALFEAALQDQELFDALAREQALRDLLGDPAARAQLLAAVDDVPAPWHRRWWRPVPAVALAAALALVAILAVRHGARAPRPMRMAKLDWPAARLPEVAPGEPLLPPPPEGAPAARPYAAPYAAPFSLPGGMPHPSTPPRPASAPSAAPAAPPAAAPAKAPRPMLDASTRAAEARLGQYSDQAQSLPSAGSALPVNGFAVNGSTSAGLRLSDTMVHGTVTDAAGAAIPSATVEVRSMATGDVFRTSTDPNGGFSAPQPPGSDYQVRASAPGFRTTTASGVTPPTGVPAPVSVRLEVGAVTESVDVISAIPLLAPPAAAGGGPGGGGAALAGAVPVRKAPAAPAPQVPSPQQAGPGGLAASATGAFAAAPPPAPPRLQYQILRRMAGGNLVEVAANGTVARGAALILRITPDADGYVRVSQSNGRAIAAQAVRGMQPFDAPLPKMGKAGRVEFQLLFSSRPLPSKAVAETGQGATTARAGSAGTLARRNASPQQTLVTITLNIQ